MQPLASLAYDQSAPTYRPSICYSQTFLRLGRTLLGHNEQVAVSVSQAAVIHGRARRVHVDGIAFFALRAGCPSAPNH